MLEQRRREEARHVARVDAVIAHAHLRGWHWKRARTPLQRQHRVAFAQRVRVSAQLGERHAARNRHGLHGKTDISTTWIIIF